MRFPPRCFHSSASTAALSIDANVFRGHLAGAGSHSPFPQRARRCFRGAGRAAVPPQHLPAAGGTQRPYLTSPRFAKARPRQRSGSCRVSPSSPHLTTGHSTPRSPCPTPDLPASRSGRRGSPRRAGQGGRRAPAPRSPPAATSGRKQQRACAPPPALEPRHVLPCSLRGAALRWRAAAPRGACADLQPRSMRSTAAAATARGSVPRQVLPLPGRRGNAPRRPPGPRSTCAAAFCGSPPAAAPGRQRRARLLRCCRRRFKIGTRSGQQHRLPPSHAPGRYANKARVPSPLPSGPAPSAGTGAGREGCLGAGQSPGRPSWRHANEPGSI